MNNEEKAKEIVDKNAMLPGILIGKYSALEMAEWKDQQFREYLEKKIKTLVEKKFPISLFGEDKGKYDAMQEIINELFPESEQDNTDREE